MNEFNKVTQSVLGEAQIDTRIDNLYREISDLLSQKGLKAYEQDEILKVVQKAIKLGFNEGYKAAEQNPFR